MFDVAGNGSPGSIGRGTSTACIRCCSRSGFGCCERMSADEVARTLLFDAATGEGCIKVVGKAEKIL